MKKLILPLSVLFAATAAGGLCALPKDAVAADYAWELFECTDAYVESNAALPSSAGIPDGRRGVLVSAAGSGAEVRLSDPVTGKFRLEFTPYSSVAYGGNQFESSAFDNGYEDIVRLSLTFEDESGEKFSVLLEGGAPGNNVTVNASVLAGNDRAGVSYNGDGGAVGNTTLANAAGVYTFLYGTSFSNVAVSGGKYSSDYVKPVGITFDPFAMKVYGTSYGYGESAEEERLIWDLSQTVCDGKSVGKAYERFSEYTVTLGFDSVRSGKRGELVLWSLNGQSLSSTVLGDDAAPNAFVKDVPAGKVGEAYALPVPGSYDVVNGAVDFAGTVEVTSPEGKRTDVTGLSGGKFASGASFTPQTAGEYTVTYVPEESGRRGEPFSVPVTVTEARVIEVTVEKDIFGVGENLVIPQGKLGSETVSVQVTGPDGAVLASPYKAEKEGCYTVRYTADGASREIALYALGRGESLFSAPASVSFAYGVSAVHGGVRGMRVTSSVANAALTYAPVIDLTGKTKDDVLVSVSAEPRGYRSRAMNQITVRLTDPDDASNYVSVTCAASDAESDASLVRAGGAGQTLTGVNPMGTPEAFTGGGTPIRHSFTGEQRYVPFEEAAFEVRFDYAERAIYTTGGKLVADLDDNAHFAKAWEGFPQGKAILTVSVQEIAGDGASYLVRQVDGKELTEGYYRDCVAPRIGLEATDYLAQSGRPFPIPEATVTDNYDPSPVLSVQAFDADGTPVAIAENAFTPSEAGDYVLRYVARDASGNTRERLVRVEAVTDPDAVRVTLASDIPSSALVGEEVVLPAATVAGGVGGGMLQITAEGKSTHAKYDAAGGSFIPLYADTYTVVYHATDYVGNVGEATGEIEVTLGTAPILSGEVSFPRVFVSGRSYTLPGLTAKDYASGAAGSFVSVEAAVSVTVDGKAAAVANGTFTPEIEGGRADAVVTYRAHSEKGGGDAVRTFTVPVVRLRDADGLLVPERYFLVSEGVETAVNDSYIDFSTQTSGSSVGFIKPVYADGFDLNFDVPGQANNVDKLILTLTDAADASKQVRFEIIKAGSADAFSYLSVNGGERVVIVGSFYESTQRLRVTYDNGDYSVRDNTGLPVTIVRDYADGSPFRGFSDEVDFTVSFGTVTGDATLRFYKLGNQFMSGLITDDTVGPAVVLEADLMRNVRKGTVVTVPRAKAFDILGFSTEITVSVRKDGKLILDRASAAEEHTFTADGYGEYFVNYSAVDDNLNTTDYVLAVTVRDDVAPTIAFEGDERTVNAGDTFSLFAATVTDNEDAAENIKLMVFVIDPNNYMHNVTGSESFATTVKGVYTIRYFAMDSAGNVAIRDVLVKARG